LAADAVFSPSLSGTVSERLEWPAGIIRFLFRRLSHRGGRPVLRERRRYLLLCCPGTGGGTDLVCRRIGPGGGVICGHASLRGAHSLVGVPGGQLRAPRGGQITADNYPPSRSTPTLRPGRSGRLNLLLTISEHHLTSPPGHVCGRSPHSSRRRLFDLSRGGVSDMSVDNARPEANPLFAFSLMIVGAFAAGLPMAVAIIWVCS
jgi:hypothetical protein